MFLASRRELIFNETSCIIPDNLFPDLVASLPLPPPLSLSLFFLFHFGSKSKRCAPLRELFVVLEQKKGTEETFPLATHAYTYTHTHEYRS